MEAACSFFSQPALGLQATTSRYRQPPQGASPPPPPSLRQHGKGKLYSDRSLAILRTASLKTDSG